MAARFIDPNHPFFASKGRRVAVVAVCTFWAAVEAFMGNFGWAALFLALAGWCTWVFTRPKAGPRPASPEKPEGNDAA
jgi:hypothetical protein